LVVSKSHFAAPALAGARMHWTQTMKNKTLNVEQIWKQFEDSMAPRLGFSIVDHVVYSHLLRHGRLEGKVRLRFWILWLAGHIKLSGGPVRESVRRLAEKVVLRLVVLRLVDRSKAGHVVEVRLLDEIRAARPNRIENRDGAEGEGAGGH
jgi:hypothetical protein